MSREIKFRAWEIGKNKMIYQEEYRNGSEWYECLAVDFSGNILSYIQEQYYPSISEELKGFELMQYTGLKDINGVEIYEGDIVRWINYLGKIITISEVFESEGCFRLWKSKHGDEINLCDCTLMFGEIEVIGNIYENPELMEQNE